MTRREFVVVVGAAAVALPGPRPVHAQQVKRIGFLRVGEPPQDFIAGFRQGLREQGLTEGQHVVIDWGLAGSVGRLPDALAELIRLKVDVVVASGTSSVLLARDAARSVPVVFVAAVDPVAMGLVTSLARPGGTITGITAVAEELNGKRLQLLQQVIPTSPVSPSWSAPAVRQRRSTRSRPSVPREVWACRSSPHTTTVSSKGQWPRRAGGSPARRG